MRMLWLSLFVVVCVCVLDCEADARRGGEEETQKLTNLFRPARVIGLPSGEMATT
jgi:hypothetical protein